MILLFTSLNNRQLLCKWTESFDIVLIKIFLNRKIFNFNLIYHKKNSLWAGLKNKHVFSTNTLLDFNRCFTICLIVNNCFSQFNSHSPTKDVNVIRMGASKSGTWSAYKTTTLGSSTFYGHLRNLSSWTGPVGQKKKIYQLAISIPRVYIHDDFRNLSNHTTSKLMAKVTIRSGVMGNGTTLKKPRYSTRTEYTNHKPMAWNKEKFFERSEPRKDSQTTKRLTQKPSGPARDASSQLAVPYHCFDQWSMEPTFLGAIKKGWIVKQAHNRTQKHSQWPVSVEKD